MKNITWTDDGLKVYIGDTVTWDITNDELSLYIIIFGICVGLVIGLVASYFTRTAAHRLTKALISGGHNTPETAVTLGELGVSGKWQLKRMLKSGKVIRRTVLCANEDEMPQNEPGKLKKFWLTKFLGQELPQKTDFSVARFYIPEENRVSAEVRYSGERLSPAGFIITIVAIIAACVGAVFVAPDLITMAQNVFGK